MEFIDKLTDWELKYDLFEKGKVRDFCFYTFLRRELVNTAVNSKNGVKADPFVANGQEDTGLKLFLKLLKKSEKTNMKDVDLLILCHPRRNKVGDAYESVFTDFLEEEFPNSLTFERTFQNHSHLEPAVTKNICYQDRIVLKAYIARLLAKHLKKKEYAAIKAEIKAVMDGPIDEFEKENGVDLRRKTYYDRAVILYYFYQSRRKDYNRFLDRVRPKAVVEVVSKSVDALIINELAKDRGIPVIELQHSLLGPIAKYPAGIYEKQSPDYYLSYSDYWSEYQTYPIKAENVFSCGSQYFERQVKAYKKPVVKSAEDKIKVLFISGLAYGPQLSEVAVQLKKASKDDVEIIYKLHPDEFSKWRELYPALEENNINVIDSKDVSIYEFFNDSDAQVGVFSTAIYEGIAFDIDTYILNITFAAEFIKFCEDGYGTLIESGEQLYENLIARKGAGSAGGNSSLAEKFWKSNARENIIARIHEITGI